MFGDPVGLRIYTQLCLAYIRINTEEAKIGNYKFHLIIPEADSVQRRLRRERSIGARWRFQSKYYIKKKNFFRRLISNSDVDYYYCFFFLRLSFFFFLIIPISCRRRSPRTRIKLQSHSVPPPPPSRTEGRAGDAGQTPVSLYLSHTRVREPVANRPRVEHFSPSKTR